MLWYVSNLSISLKLPLLWQKLLIIFTRYPSNLCKISIDVFSLIILSFIYHLSHITIWFEKLSSLFFLINFVRVLLNSSMMSRKHLGDSWIFFTVFFSVSVSLFSALPCTIFFHLLTFVFLFLMSKCKH